MLVTTACACSYSLCIYCFTALPSLAPARRDYSSSLYTYGYTHGYSLYTYGCSPARPGGSAPRESSGGWTAA